MAEVLKIVSVQRGHDPRDFVLAAFGGAGPLHAAALASELGIAEVICPPIPGAFSALGLVGTDLKRDYVQHAATPPPTSPIPQPWRLPSSRSRAREPRCSTGPASRPSGGDSSARSTRAIRDNPLSSGCRFRRARSTTAALEEIAESVPRPSPADLWSRQSRRAGPDRQRPCCRDRRDPAAVDPRRDGASGTSAVKASARSGSVRPARSEPSIYDRRPDAGRARDVGSGGDRIARSPPFLFRPDWQAKMNAGRLRVADAPDPDGVATMTMHRTPEGGSRHLRDHQEQSLQDRRGDAGGPGQDRLFAAA